MTRFASPADLLDRAGSELCISDWLLIDQQRINDLADTTGDHQWIHLGLERAKEGPLGVTIAHGYLSSRSRRSCCSRCCRSTVRGPW